jgi:CTP synthase
MKYIVVVGGVISGTGKGVSAASIGLLMKLRGMSVQIIKFDPYLNVNAGILAPSQHGECFLCDDGTETDLDLGHYERIAGVTVSAQNICTSGTLFKELIVEQERGDYLGQTVQIIPHLTDKIQKRLIDLGKESDIVIAEIGGTVGDIESASFLEAIRQFKQKRPNDVIMVMVAPILWVPTIKEFKTKPLQNAVKELQVHGLQPDLLLCRVDREIPNGLLDKIANLTNVSRESTFTAPDVSSIYHVPVEFYNRHIDDLCVDLLHLKRSYCRIHKLKELIEKDIKTEIEIAVVGKYANHDEAYISLKEALFHAGLSEDTSVKIRWIKADDLESAKDGRGIGKILNGVDGIIVPGGFDSRGAEGKIRAIKYVREKGIPFLGICLGLQCAVIEFARNVCGIEKANSMEFDKDTPDPVIHYVKGQENVAIKSASMRLGAYDCELSKGSMAMEIYGGKKTISERHRHRLEVNPKYLDCFTKYNFRVSGINPQSGLIEIMELDRKNHPYFIGTQAHPEFKSKLGEVAPLFKGLVSAAKVYRKANPDKNKEDDE